MRHRRRRRRRGGRLRERTKTVPVQREEVRVEREPITEANRDAGTAGSDLTADEHEVSLHEDEVVVDKQIVLKERVLMENTSAPRSARSRRVLKDRPT